MIVYEYEAVIGPRGAVHRVFDGDNYTFCSKEFPLELKGWRKPEKGKIKITCKGCLRGRAGY
jgi:hypothetical protein